MLKFFKFPSSYANLRYLWIIFPTYLSLTYLSYMQCLCACRRITALSDAVTQFVRQFVCQFVCQQGVFLSLKSQNVVSMTSKECFIEVSRMFHTSFMNRKIQGCFKKFSGVFQGCFQGVYSFKSFKRSSQGDSRKFQSCFD